MPIINVCPVVSASNELPADAAQRLADSIAHVLNVETGRVWVRLTELPDRNYAENAVVIEGDDLPVFVEVLHADWPEEAARVIEAQALAAAVAASLQRPVGRVHLEYAPPGRGRYAFGGTLIT